MLTGHAAPKVGSTDPDAGYLLEVTDLAKTYPPRRSGESELRVLRNVNLGVRRGEFVVVIGPSGSGKSTLLNLIAGLEPPSQGQVVLADESVGETLGKVGYMHQRDLLLPWRSVLENGRIGLELQGVDKAVANEKTAELAVRFGLDDVLDQYPWQLSGGMRQRVALLRAALPDTKVLLLDEPFGALDAITRSHLQTWLSDVLDRRDKAVVLVTHDVEEAILLGDRVVVLNGQPGEIVGEYDVRIDRPRSSTSTTGPGFVALKRSLLAALAGGPQ